ncbi:sodium- and chloride-dependent glycine transporter 1-like [Limulus polyphemus]|uniref:Transporter n=1 Tax=Limulus polyphemus TaxID=6850 RepID=A0ABM1BUS8_LIMPO|nr:sodium- and chloride-dependent glycine transporter 1-like [Limulus polyphemus]
MPEVNIQNRDSKVANSWTKSHVNGSIEALDVGQSENEHRGGWTNQFDFFLSCLGYAVGLGNVWRFPYLCFRNGGGAFLVPYVLMLSLCGLPVFFLELSLGQFHGQGPNIAFRHMVPIFHGIGYAMLIISFLVVLYYNMIIAWTLFYTFASFTSQLGWEFCGNEWNTMRCYNVDQYKECLNQNLTYWNNTCYDAEAYCNGISNFTFGNLTHCINETALSLNKSAYVPVAKATKRVSPSEDYYLHYVLGISNSWEEFGELRWQLVLCLLLAWIIVGLCLIKGVQSSGKVVYFTALFPYVVLIILLVRGATLDGAADGIYFYIVPKWEKLLEAQVWGDAAVQIFYSLGPGFGGLLTLASYNRFNNNCYRDAVIIAMANCSTSVFAGFVIFSILGFMAFTLNVPVEEVIESGQGLAFIAYPEAVTKMPVSPLWAFLFFFMLITLGLDSQFTMCETLVTAVQDQWPNLRKYKHWVVIGTCLVCFVIGLPMCAEGGVYLFTLIDSYAAGWSILVLGLLECIIISWVYGINRYCDDIAQMIGFKPNIYWRVSWTVTTPLIMLGILIFSWVTYTPAKFAEYSFPTWVNGIGWGMAAISVIMIPIFALYEVKQAINEGKPVISLFRPTKEWGPAIGTSKPADMTLPSLGDAPYLNEVKLPGGPFDNPSFQHTTHM